MTWWQNIIRNSPAILACLSTFITAIGFEEHVFEQYIFIIGEILAVIGIILGVTVKPK